MRVLVTGGAGFVGGNVAVALARRHPDWQLVAFDNLRRAGSSLNLVRLREAGVEFVHGDVRDPCDLAAVSDLGAVVECSAEPSALAGIDSGLDYLVRTNLVGAYNCLETARHNAASFVFLSTSRVYPVAALLSVGFEETETRFELSDVQQLPGVSASGVAEAFPLVGARTPYGATKLAAELLIAEYVESFGLRAVVDRCGVIAGPWQMGQVDQGVFTYWLLTHYFARPLRYIGFGGTGKQVRDLLHVHDLVDLVDDQLMRPEHWSGVTVNVGGGRRCSLSLLEATELCREITGNEVDVAAAPETRPGDVPIYFSDTSKLNELTDWRPEKDARAILEDTYAWAREYENSLRSSLGFDRVGR